MNSFFQYSIDGFLSVYEHELEKDKTGRFKRYTSAVLEASLRPDKPILATLVRWSKDNKFIYFYVISILYKNGKFVQTTKESFSEYIHIPIENNGRVKFYKVQKDNVAYHYILPRKNITYFYPCGDQFMICTNYRKEMKVINDIECCLKTRSNCDTEFILKPISFIMNVIPECECFDKCLCKVRTMNDIENKDTPNLNYLIEASKYCNENTQQIKENGNLKSEPEFEFKLNSFDSFACASFILDDKEYEDLFS